MPRSKGVWACERPALLESQILAVLQDGEAGMPVAELNDKHRISRDTYFAWKSKYAGATVSELRRVRELEAETRAEADVRRGGARERPSR